MTLTPAEDLAAHLQELAHALITAPGNDTIHTGAVEHRYATAALANEVASAILDGKFDHTDDLQESDGFTEPPSVAG